MTDDDQIDPSGQSRLRVAYERPSRSSERADVDYGDGSEDLPKLAASWQPWRVLDLDFAKPIPPLQSHDAAGNGWGGAWVLLRVFDEPVGSMRLRFDAGNLTPETIAASVPEDVAAVIRDRLHAAGVTEPDDGRGLPTSGCEPGGTPPFLARRQAVMDSGPAATVVVCTRDQPRGLARCLASLQAQSYPGTQLLVVDNASTTDAARSVVESSAGPFPTTYVFEPRPGLSNARNSALQEVTTELIAWIDDDETADPHWVTSVVSGFLSDPGATAVCGVMVPGELETLPQFWFEEYGGHSKGRGFAPAMFSPETRRQQSPLLPLPPFGTGGNMAMRGSVIKALGGFDRALGAGTRTGGGEDTRALTDILLAGGRVRYQPTAVTHHYHRRDYEGFRRQFYGYGAGLSAFYTSLLWDRPLLLLPLLRLMPRALKQFRDPNGLRLGGIAEHFPDTILREHRRGLVRGPLEYVRCRLRG